MFISLHRLHSLVECRLHRQNLGLINAALRTEARTTAAAKRRSRRRNSFSAVRLDNESWQHDRPPGRLAPGAWSVGVHTIRELLTTDAPCDDIGQAAADCRISLPTPRRYISSGDSGGDNDSGCSSNGSSAAVPTSNVAATWVWSSSRLSCVLFQ